MVEICLDDLDLEPLATGPQDFRAETSTGTEIRVRRHNCWYCGKNVYIWKHWYQYKNMSGPGWRVIGGGAKNGAEVACKNCRNKMARN